MEKQETADGIPIIKPIVGHPIITGDSETGRALSYIPPPELPKKTQSWWSFLKFRWFTSPFS